MMSLTAEQVRALASDSSVARSAAGLASSRRWQGLGRGCRPGGTRGVRAVWGECQGSGKNPYQVRALEEIRRVVTVFRELRAADVASGLVGAVAQDLVQDRVVWLEYPETFVKERGGWRDLYRSCREMLT